MMCLITTLFPVPEGPRIAEALPAGIWRSMPRRTAWLPNDLWTPWVSMAKPSVGGVSYAAGRAWLRLASIVS